MDGNRPFLLALHAGLPADMHGKPSAVAGIIGTGRYAAKYWMIHILAEAVRMNILAYDLQTELILD